MSKSLSVARDASTKAAANTVYYGALGRSKVGSDAWDRTAREQVLRWLSRCGTLIFHHVQTDTDTSEKAAIGLSYAVFWPVGESSPTS